MDAWNPEKQYRCSVIRIVVLGSRFEDSLSECESWRSFHRPLVFEVMLLFDLIVNTEDLLRSRQVVTHRRFSIQYTRERPPDILGELPVKSF